MLGGRGGKGRTCGCGKTLPHPLCFPLPPTLASLLPINDSRTAAAAAPRGASQGRPVLGWAGQCGGRRDGRTGPSIWGVWGDRRNVGARESGLGRDDAVGLAKKPPWAQNARATVLTQQQGDAVLRTCPTALGIFDLGGASAWGGWRNIGSRGEGQCRGG